MTLALHIGGYTLLLAPEPAGPRLGWPLRPYEPFLADSANPAHLRFDIHLVDELPELPQGPLLYDACHGLWQLYAGASGPVLQALDTKTQAPRSRSIISRDYAHIEVWLLARRDRERRGWLPMHVLNPVAEVCLLTRLGREGGFLLHAAGVLMHNGDGGEGWLFTGRSGAGKSTVSGLMAARGGSVVSDERTIVRRRGGELFLYGTPWVGDSQFALNRHGRLTRLFCIRHGERRHALTAMRPMAASQHLLQQCFLPQWDREAMQGALSAIGDLAERIDCAELAFLKDPSVADFLMRSPSAAQPVKIA